MNPPSGDPFVYEDWVFAIVKVNSRSAILSAEQWDFLEVLQSLKLLKVHDILVTHLYAIVRSIKLEVPSKIAS